MSHALGRVRGVSIGLTALALSIGWGIRGNFGHEYGAMLPGALAAMAAVLTSGRRDWLPAVPFFAMFGALGWSFGGSISYMQVIGYTHSGHSLSVLYGFANLFVIGFLWAAPGGAGTAFTAEASPRRVAELFTPMGAVFLAWWLQGVAIEPALRGLGVDLNWYDTDWVAATLALAAAGLVAAARRRVDRSTSLVIHMAAGWWAGFALLVLVLGLRMTPPRGDNWAGCLGMVMGILAYCLRHGLPEVARATLVTGFLGGIGFAAASMLKLVEVTSGYETNWHSVLEQTTGLFNGIAVALAMRGLARRVGPLPEAAEMPPVRRCRMLAVAFVLLMIPYLNLRKNVADWTRRSVPEVMYGIPAWAWFDAAFAAVAAGLAVLLVRHARRPLAVVPSTPLGAGQALFLLLLAIMVVGNFERALVGFADQRLITEGVIHVNAVLCAVWLLVSDSRPDVSPALGESGPPRRWGRLVAAGLAAAAVSVLADWAIVRGIYGDRFAGHANLHIRFGPGATTGSSRGGPAPADANVRGR
ncbi:hypothetical protein OJF2_29920 [Aquisphaera giovannonii]|uniref:Uncharacterized protein n=1 Tax=Aquisphaera giovannonii TaxID=406548 RepID=A0A5B9W1N4_9BACT|nr:hypothetical protein [Aquisphaera giovannonii]QEH34453.1 hypothetical protein OJF2_29920 [Aquisphaera giovannonii]